jgi:hypothetical protein
MLKSSRRPNVEINKDFVLHVSARVEALRVGFITMALYLPADRRDRLAGHIRHGAKTADDINGALPSGINLMEEFSHLLNIELRTLAADLLVPLAQSDQQR